MLILNFHIFACAIVGDGRIGFKIGEVYLSRFRILFFILFEDGRETSVKVCVSFARRGSLTDEF